MLQKQIVTASPITLVGGGPVLQGDLDESLERAPISVAADGGADRMRALGGTPDWGIGDLDSMSAVAREGFAPGQLIRDTAQDTTDLQKCLTRIDAPLILGLGFLGGRIDHELAALSALAAHRGPPLVLIGAQDVVMHLRAPLVLALDAGMRLSLFPMCAVQGRSEGLRWPIDGLDLRPDGVIGTSNEVTGAVRLEADGPGLLLILPRRALAVLLGAIALARSPIHG